MKKLFNIGLLISFILTFVTPFFGVHSHKLASVIFLVFAIIHIYKHRKSYRR